MKNTYCIFLGFCVIKTEEYSVFEKTRANILSTSKKHFVNDRKRNCFFLCLFVRRAEEFRINCGIKEDKYVTMVDCQRIKKAIKVTRRRYEHKRASQSNHQLQLVQYPLLPAGGSRSSVTCEQLPAGFTEEKC